MILAIDVNYTPSYAKSVGILFEWQDEMPREIVLDEFDQVEEYISGEFYKRELPCILRILGRVDLGRVELIVVDGNIYADNQKRMGLDGRLWGFYGVGRGD